MKEPVGTPDSEFRTSKIAWSLQTGWTGFTPELRETLAKAFPGLDLDLACNESDAWLRLKPGNATKKNWFSFLTNWLRRSSPSPSSHVDESTSLNDGKKMNGGWWCLPWPTTGSRRGLGGARSGRPTAAFLMGPGRRCSRPSSGRSATSCARRTNCFWPPSKWLSNQPRCWNGSQIAGNRVRIAPNGVPPGIPSKTIATHERLISGPITKQHTMVGKIFGQLAFLRRSTPRVRRSG